MKLALAVVALFVAGFIGIDYASNYALGGVEAGLPNGGAGKLAQYHEDNLFSYYLSDFDSEYKPSWFGSEEKEDGERRTNGQVTNPFAMETQDGVADRNTASRDCGN
ncbi:hypothetical protein [Aporhodopirellula aestuarii]|uniref:Uncharacterized protein n=1 Tax=Aporhodopirellula aestuarii TaxID=2950107 RepID=A0ABT0U4R6_9BACT|nr:hypothetical protein [Aporhodopirellula aestuarii]MCM2371932.1 hypothetical protein [Aporhodopirellula aestuarii]